MAIINLRKHYYPLYTKDTFIEVPDEVAAVMEECRLYESRQEHRKSYYHVYSMDCSPGIENHAMFLVMSPEDLLIKEIDDAVAELMPARLVEALTHLTPAHPGQAAPRPVYLEEKISGDCRRRGHQPQLRQRERIRRDQKIAEIFCQERLAG